MVDFVRDYDRIFFGLLIFSFFHSVGAQEWFKEALGRILSDFFVTYFWRFTYCAISYVLFYQLFSHGFFEIDRSYQQILWHYPDELHLLASLLRLTGVIIMYLAFLQMDYFGFLGLRPLLIGLRVCLFRSSRAPKLPVPGVDYLKANGIFRVIRHPMNLGGVLVSIPLEPTVNNLVFLASMISYTVIGSYYEEKRLVKNMGEAYSEYRMRVGGYFPILPWRRFILTLRKTQ